MSPQRPGPRCVTWLELQPTAVGSTFFNHTEIQSQMDANLLAIRCRFVHQRRLRLSNSFDCCDLQSPVWEADVGSFN